MLTSICSYIKSPLTQSLTQDSAYGCSPWLTENLFSPNASFPIRSCLQGKQSSQYLERNKSKLLSLTWSILYHLPSSFPSNVRRRKKTPAWTYSYALDFIQQRRNLEEYVFTTVSQVVPARAVQTFVSHVYIFLVANKPKKIEIYVTLDEKLVKLIRYVTYFSSTSIRLSRSGIGRKSLPYFPNQQTLIIGLLWTSWRRRGGNSFGGLEIRLACSS